MLDKRSTLAFMKFMDVKTAGRTVDLFEIFAVARKPLTLSEISRALNAPQSSCFNLVRALEMRGYLYGVGGKKRVYPTRKLLDCAEAISSFDTVVPLMQPLLEALCKETGETVILGALQGRKVVYLDVAEGQQTIRYMSKAGEIKPVHSSAIGKALLLSMSPDDRKNMIDALSLNKVTDATLTDPEALMQEIEASNERGFTQTVGENVADVAAVAKPMWINGMAYGIAVAGPTSRLVPRMAELAAMIEARIQQSSVEAASRDK